MEKNGNKGPSLTTYEEKIEFLKSQIKNYDDFPKAGILFRDIFPLLLNPEAVKILVELMVDYIKKNHADVEIITGLESRGFIFAPLLSHSLGVSFAPMRKKAKLPGETIKVEYALEYGTDTIEMQKESVEKGQKVIIVDDLIATGGTMLAGIQLIEKLGGQVLKCLSVIELVELKGRDKLGKDKLHSFLQM